LMDNYNNTTKHKNHLLHTQLKLKANRPPLETALHADLHCIRLKDRKQ
jgi:hypothetical protein